MLNLTPIQPAHMHYTFVEQLLEHSFPEEERRETVRQRECLEKCDNFHCLLIHDGELPLGVMTYWQFERFCYLEHFALAPECRNQGYGSAALRQWMKLIGKPGVLEVEHPTDAMRRRRIAFYQRLEWNLWEHQCYVQPPYREGGMEVPLILMASEGLNEEHDFAEVQCALHGAIRK